MKHERSEKIEEESAPDAYALALLMRRQLRVQVQRHPYVALATAAGLGLALGGAGMSRWIATAAAFALRQSLGWAAREGLRRIVEAPSPAAFSSARHSAQSQQADPH